MHRPWEIIRSETLVKDGWIDLRADQCRTPAGAAIAPYYVLNYPEWVTVVALTPDDRVVMVRQYRHAVGCSVLELPGGVVDAGDATLADAARRELLEETGHAAPVLRPVCSLFPNPATHTNRTHTFLALDAVPGGQRALEAGEEGMEVCTVPLAEALDAAGQGRLGHALHVAALYAGLQMAGRLRLVPRAQGE